ncbi:MAG: transporter substrate-binding domain-containing protein [Desulfamplus sp.]|nr:transporter substrate-binding domain-containing protein [Desulfamplus sp.]
MITKKLWIAIICFCSFHLSIASTYARSLEEIKKSGELRLCVAGSSYELYTKTGTAFAESLGVKANVKKLEAWDTLFQNKEGVVDKEAVYTPYLMEMGECDCYPNDMVINEWRLKKMDFAALFKTRMTVVINKDNQNNIKSEVDLKGKRAAVMKGTSYHTWMEEKNKKDFADNPIQITLMSTDESMNVVDSKTVDFTIIGADGALNWTRNKVKNSMVGFFVGPVNQVGWGFRKDDKELIEAAKIFFDSQRKLNSKFDLIWKEKVGISLSEFNLFITSLLGE